MVLRHATKTEKLGIAGVVCLTLTGCNDGPIGPGDPSGLLRTDQASYTAVVIEPNAQYTIYGFTLVAEFTNKTSQVLYLDRCYPDSPGPIYSMEAVGAGDVRAGYGPYWGCVGHDQQFRIEPGHSRIDTINVAGPNAWDGVTLEPLGVMDGLFRLVYTVKYCRDCSDVAPEVLRASNVFRVTQSTVH